MRICHLGVFFRLLSHLPTYLWCTEWLYIERWWWCNTRIQTSEFPINTAVSWGSCDAVRCCHEHLVLLSPSNQNLLLQIDQDGTIMADIQNKVEINPHYISYISFFCAFVLYFIKFCDVLYSSYWHHIVFTWLYIYRFFSFKNTFFCPNLTCKVNTPY